MKAEHYFTEKPGSALKTKKIQATVRNHIFQFFTVSSVFSHGRIDRGSALLAEHAIVKPQWDVLDLGCGWGLVGIVIKKTFPSTTVVLTDINQRAVKFASQNAKLNHVKLAILQGNLYEPVKQKKFHTIITNPPMKAGRDLCYSIIEQAKKHLKKGGLLQLVALHNRGGLMLAKKMEEVFGNVKTIAKKSGFRVYVSEN